MCTNIQFFLWTSCNYTFHIIVRVPAFLETETRIDPGFVQIKFFFFILYQCFHLFSYSEGQKTMSTRSMTTSRLFMCLLHTKPISFKNLFKDVPRPSPLSFLLQNWNNFTHGGYSFILNLESLYSIVLTHLLKQSG